MYYTKQYPQKNPRGRKNPKYHITFDQTYTLCLRDCDAWQLFEHFDPKVPQICRECLHKVTREVDKYASELLGEDGKDK